MSLTFTQQKKPSSSLIPARRGQPEHQTTFQPPEAQEAPPQPGFGHEFSKVDVLPSERTGQQFAQSCPLALPSPRACPFGGACHTCPAPVQAKLTISQPGDKYEQEADRVADAVMAMPEPRNGQRLQRECSECDQEAQRQGVEPEDEEKEEEEPEETASASLLQRQDAGEEKEEEEEPEGTASPKLLQRQDAEEKEEEEEKTASAKSQPDRTPQVTPAVSASINALRGRGQPLPPSSRAFFEPRFGHDFSRVRVHADSKAADTAQAVQAKAFTVGRDIVFGGGQYAPETTGGRRLVAHELAHVVQQGKQLSPTMYGQTPNHILRLGANPGCSAAHQNLTHQAIYNARGWLLNTVREMKKTPPTKKVRASLRRNFGNTYGVSANIPLILGRLRRIFKELAVMQLGCSGVADPICAGGFGGYTVAGSHQATVCTNNVFPAGPDWRVAALVVLHEAFHATYSNFTVDNYSGSYGITPTTANYPGPGTDPLLNADSYRTLIMDLS